MALEAVPSKGSIVMVLDERVDPVAPSERVVLYEGVVDGVMMDMLNMVGVLVLEAVSVRVPTGVAVVVYVVLNPSVEAVNVATGAMVGASVVAEMNEMVVRLVELGDGKLRSDELVMDPADDAVDVVARAEVVVPGVAEIEDEPTAELESTEAVLVRPGWGELVVMLVCSAVVLDAVVVDVGVEMVPVVSGPDVESPHKDAT